MADNNNINEQALNEKDLTSVEERREQTSQAKEEFQETGSAPIDPLLKFPTQQAAATQQAPTPQEAISAWIEQTQQAQEEAQEIAEQRQAEDIKRAQEDVQRAISDDEKRQEIIDVADEWQKEIEEEISEISQERADRDVKQLEGQRDIALEKANLELSEQKMKNERAIKAAEVNIDVEKQKASWAFNKLWLGFSSGIILEVQRIATLWATKVAELRVTAARMEAETAIQISELEFEYAKEINGVIDRNLDIQIKVKEDAIKRIERTQTNKLLSETEKQDRIDEIRDEYIKTTRKNEDNLRIEQERLSDKAIKQAQALNKEVQADRNIKLKELDRDLQSGVIAQLTSLEVANRERELWLTPWTIDATMGNSIAKSVRGLYKAAGYWKVKINDMEGIIVEAKKNMQYGASFQEAVNAAYNSSIKWNAEIARIDRARTAISSDSDDLSSAGQLIAMAEQFWEELSPTRAKAIVAWGQDAVNIYAKNLKANTRIKPKQIKPSVLWEALLENFAENFQDRNSAQSAYAELINSGYTDWQAKALMATTNDKLEVNKAWELIETKFRNSVLVN